MEVRAEKKCLLSRDNLYNYNHSGHGMFSELSSNTRDIFRIHGCVYMCL